MYVTSAIQLFFQGGLHLIFNTFDAANKKQTLKEYNEFTQATQAKTPKQQRHTDTFKRTEKYPRDSNMATNIIYITLDNHRHNICRHLID